MQNKNLDWTRWTLRSGLKIISCDPTYQINTAGSFAVRGQTVVSERFQGFTYRESVRLPLLLASRDLLIWKGCCSVVTPVRSEARSPLLCTGFQSNSGAAGRAREAASWCVWEHHDSVTHGSSAYGLQSMLLLSNSNVPTKMVAY